MEQATLRNKTDTSYKEVKNDGIYTPCFDFLHHSREPRSVEPGSGNTVVGKMGRARKTVSPGIFLQHLLLVGYAVAFAL